MSLTRNLAKQLLPPLVVSRLRRARALWRMRHAAAQGSGLRWRRVEDGVLAGYELRLPEMDGGWVESLLRGTYEPAMTAALADAVSPGDVCYDVGGHVGYYTLVMARRAGPGGEVHVFEPYAPNAARIREHLVRNADANARAPTHLHECALGGVDGRQQLVAPGHALHESPLAHLAGSEGVLKAGWHRHFASRREQTATVWRLDSWRASTGARPPAFIKIDVEGSELDVLRGARETLVAAHPLLIVDLHNARLAAKCGAFLGALGYSVEVIGHDSGGDCTILAKHGPG
jgi:FkbM family methyltransferase